MPSLTNRRSLSSSGRVFVQPEQNLAGGAIPDLTLIVPAFNEESRLPKTLREIQTFLDAWGMNYSVMVANDGSDDKTAEIAEQFGPRFSTLSLASQQGKGAAVCAGMLNAPGRVLAFTDADLPYDLTALQQGFDWIQQGTCDVVFGARDLLQSADLVQRKLSRKIASAAFRWIVSQLVSRQVPDTQCGLKLFSQDAAKRIFSRLQISGFAFDAEVVYRTEQLGIRFQKVPVTLVNEHSSTLSLSRHALPMLQDVLSMRWNSWWESAQSVESIEVHSDLNPREKKAA